MPLSLTTLRRQQTSNAKCFSQQHLNQLQQHQQNISSTNLTNATNNLIRHHFIQQPVRKQRSFIDSRFTATHTGGRSSHLSRGLSVERSHDIVQQRTFLKKQSSSTATQHHHVRTDELVKRNITTACGVQSVGGGVALLRSSRKVQAWSSTSSILKTLDKELAQLNGTVAKPKDVKITKPDSSKVDNVKNIRSKADTIPSSSTNHTSRKATKPEVNKVNLSIILSQAFHSTKEENELLISEPEEDESDNSSTDCNKCLNNQVKPKDSKKTDNIKSTSTTTTRPAGLAQQRRALYHSTRLTPNIAVTANINTSGHTNNSSALESSQNFNASPSLIVQKRPPLVRAMSAPVRSFDETSKGSFLASKRKSRRRKLNTRNISCDKESTDVLGTKDLNRKVLTRSKSVAPDVITLVSLISSEGSDSEKDDTPTASHAGSPTRKAPSLRKTGKSVSFQENYPPTFQFASKEYSHMLRRGSIAPLAQRIKINRPPTAPPGSIFHTASKFNNEMSESSNETCEEKENFSESLNNNNTKVNMQTTVPKTLEEEYDFPEYVRSRKERECWKLYMKMSTKGVNITYDTILRGMLTPTEFRQLQKQRDIEEAKAKENLECAKVLEIKQKDCSTAIERLKEGLLKN